METFEIIDGTYTAEADVQVKFTTTVEIANSQTYSEQDVLNTIASLEQRKTEYCNSIDAEIEVNNIMLAKIRAIDRTNNVITE